jgi:hypothetical protein
MPHKQTGRQATKAPWYDMGEFATLQPTVALLPAREPASEPSKPSALVAACCHSRRHACMACPARPLPCTSVSSGSVSSQGRSASLLMEVPPLSRGCAGRNRTS